MTDDDVLAKYEEHQAGEGVDHLTNEEFRRMYMGERWAKGSPSLRGVKAVPQLNRPCWAERVWERIAGGKEG